MAKVKRVIELSVEEKKFLDNFLDVLYEEFDDCDNDEEIGNIMTDIYNLCLNEDRPFPQTFEGDLVDVRVVGRE